MRRRRSLGHPAVRQPKTSLRQLQNSTETGPRHAQ